MSVRSSTQAPRIDDCRGQSVLATPARGQVFGFQIEKELPPLQTAILQLEANAGPWLLKIWAYETGDDSV